MTTRMVLLALVAVVIAGVGSQAAPPPEEARMLRGLTQEIETWRVVDGLDLSREQMQALLPLAREIRAEHDAVAAERLRSLPAFEQGIHLLREELLANNGVSDAAKQAVARAEAPWKRIEYGAAERIPERLRTATGILTPEQVQFLVSYRPGGGPRAGARHALAMAEDLLVRARQATPEQLQQGMRAIMRDGWAGIPPGQLRAMESPLRQIIAEARALSDAEFAARKGELAQRLVDLAPRPAAAREHTEGRDPSGPISRLLLNASLATVLEARLGIASPPPIGPPTEFPEALVSMVTDVRVLNLVNSLYLTPEQMGALSDIIRRADAEREAARAQQQALFARLVPLATQVRGELASGALTPATLGQAAAANAQVNQHRRQQRERMGPYIAQVKQTLHENQVMLVSEFIPCLIPVRSLTHPERIGQAQDTAGAERHLSGLRQLPRQQLEQVMPRAQERLEGLLMHRHVPVGQAEAMVADLPRVVAEARALSDTEFEIAKPDLARRLMPPERPAAAGDELDARIAEYLLSPNLLPIFAQRIASQEVAAR